MNSNEGEKLISNSNENDKNEKPVASDENSPKDDSPKVNEEAAKDEKPPEIKKKIVYRKPRNQVESEQKKMQVIWYFLIKPTHSLNYIKKNLLSFF